MRSEGVESENGETMTREHMRPHQQSDNIRATQNEDKEGQGHH
jgi:hypothetical protein